MSNCFTSAIIYREASERKSLKYFSTVQSCTFKLELTLSKLFCLKFFSHLNLLSYERLHLLHDFAVICSVEHFLSSNLRASSYEPGQPGWLDVRHLPSPLFPS